MGKRWQDFLNRQDEDDKIRNFFCGDIFLRDFVCGILFAGFCLRDFLLQDFLGDIFCGIFFAGFFLRDSGCPQMN